MKKNSIEWLKANGFDGLYTGECACTIEDYNPCGEDCTEDCCPGYKYLDPREGCREYGDFCISDSKQPPTEDEWDSICTNTNTKKGETMKVGDIIEMEGLILKAVDERALNVCDGCHFQYDFWHTTKQDRLLDNMCVDNSPCAGVIFKIVGATELDPWHNGESKQKDETQNFSGKCTFSFSVTIGPGNELRKVEDACLISYKNKKATIVELSRFTDEDGFSIADFLRDEQYDFTKEVVKQTKTNI